METSMGWRVLQRITLETLPIEWQECLEKRTSPRELELSEMHALMAPCSLHYSVDTNHSQSASQRCPSRRAILPASLPNPPVTGMTGAAKVSESQPVCAPASTSFTGTFHETHIVVDAQDYDQSLVTPLVSSLTSLPKCISTYANTSTTTVHTLGPVRHSHQPILKPSIEPHTLAPAVPLDPSILERRSLTSGIDTKCDTMISTTGAPGTPPELSESRSSKSSSYGSQFSADNDFAAGIANFEDIGLEDDDRSALQRGHDGQGQGKPSNRSDSFHSRCQTLPEINCQVRTRVTQATPRSAVGPMKRGFTSPLSTTFVSENSRPRSSSPPKRMPRSTSTYSVNLTGSVPDQSPRSSIVHSRRGSWQPQRKTIKEIEAEYHDSDDELPDDATLWNVPISPYHSTGVSPRSSFRGSPEREVAVKSPLPIPLELTQSAPSPSIRTSSLSQPISRQRLTPRSSSVTPSRSNPTSPRMPSHLRNNRAKSWNLAMSDLSEEARIVSENLAFYADISKAKDHGPQTSATQATHRGSAPTAIQLPPIQRGTLDFMPISKEKEAVLSRTRPSWLPPKDPKEEQKHLKEYQKMMAASIEAEKKKENRMKSIQTRDDYTWESLNRIWDFYVNPATDITIIDRRVHDLSWRGIPSRLRGKVWERTVGNSLGLTSKTYNRAQQRANAIKQKSLENLSHLEKQIASWFTDIDRDAETAFPELGLFERSGPLRQDLVSVCEAYVCYRSDTGYLYGLQLIAALVLLQIPDPSAAFIFMANCLNKPTPLAFHTCDIASTQRTYDRVISNLGVKFPRLHDYLFETMERGGLGFTGQEAFEPVFRTLFSNGLDFDRLCRVWDVWIFQGDRALIQTVVAVLGSLQSQIFSVTGDMDLKRRNVQEMLGWGPFNRTGKGSYWKLEVPGDIEAFVDEIDAAGKFDYTGR